MRVVQSISLDTELDEDVLIYLKSVPNKSQFIKDCIRTHLSKKDNFTNSQIEQIREIVLLKWVKHLFLFSPKKK